MTIFDFASAAIVVVACAAAAAGCFVLNRRIQRLASTERGIGKAMSEMSAAVSQFETLLAAAEKSAREASIVLEAQLVQARRVVARLEPVAGAAPRAAAARAASQRAPGEDPLSDVVPKGASPGGRDGAGQALTADSAGQRVADLVRRRSMPDPDRTTRVRSAQA